MTRSQLKTIIQEIVRKKLSEQDKSSTGEPNNPVTGESPTIKAARKELENAKEKELEARRDLSRVERESAEFAKRHYSVTNRTQQQQIKHRISVGNASEKVSDAEDRFRELTSKA